MIRINLLPGSRKEKRAAGGTAGGGGTQGWFVAYAGAAVVAGIALFFVYMHYSDLLEEQNHANSSLQRDIRDLESESANIDTVRAQLESSRQLEQVVNELQRARYGPTNVLMEISRMLSVGGAPTTSPDRIEQIRHQNPTLTYNPNWDPRRVWLTEFTEEDRVCNIKGVGKTNQDVAEFLRRLTLSESFEQVVLVKTEGAEDQATHVPVIQFELNCRVIY